MRNCTISQETKVSFMPARMPDAKYLSVCCIPSLLVSSIIVLKDCRLMLEMSLLLVAQPPSRSFLFVVCVYVCVGSCLTSCTWLYLMVASCLEFYNGLFIALPHLLQFLGSNRMWRFVSDEDTNKNVFFANDVDEVPSSRSFKFSGRQKIWD